MSEYKQYNVKDVVDHIKTYGYKLTRNKLINYERKKLINPQHTVGGYRLYNEKDVDTLLVICHLLFLGFTIKEISIILNWKREQIFRQITFLIILEILTGIKKDNIPEDRRKIDVFLDWAGDGERFIHKFTNIPDEIKAIEEGISKKEYAYKEVTEKFFLKTKELEEGNQKLAEQIRAMAKTVDIKKIIGKIKK